jgi:protein TonB
MMSLAADSRRELLRWALCGAIVLAAHGSIAAAMVYWRDLDESDAPAAALVVDLAPMPMAPANLHEEIPPGPEQVQAMATPDKPVEKTEEKTEEKVETKDTQQVMPELAQAESPEVVMEAAPPKPEPEPPTPVDNQPPAPVTTAPQLAAVEQGPVFAAPTQGKLNLTNSNVEQNWNRKLSALLERNKRYPDAARGAQGTAHVAFTLDRQGRVLASRLIKSSGSAVLDQEALEWPKRAQPFPPPPPEVLNGGEKVDRSVPYRFSSH